MSDYLKNLLSTNSLSPHGICLTWRPELIWTHVLSDAAIGLAYFSIPIALATFLTRRRDVAFGWIFWCFAVFILACGTTHFMSIWTLWVPDYGIEGVIKAITACASIVTAIALWQLLPKAIALPSPAELRRVNDDLLARVAERDDALLALSQANTERLRAEELLRHSQKMEAIGQLTGGMAHDFNNLLSVILGSLEMISRRASDPASVTRYAKIGSDAGRRGSDLTEKLLSFSRRQVVHPTTIELNVVLREFEPLLRQALGETIPVVLDLDPRPAFVSLDVGQLQAALLNLTGNARDAMPSGGTLTVKTTRVPAPIAPGRARSDGPSDAFIQLVVADTGVGMDRATAARAFDPFFTTKEVGRGTGLGLSQVYGFVRQAGGVCVLTSDLGQGCAVEIGFPSVPYEPTTDFAAPVLPRAAQEVVLVVEDDSAVRDMAAESLALLGYEVLTAPDARSAMRVIEQPIRIDILFSDVVMPGGMSGADLALWAKQARPNIRVLLTSGYINTATGGARELPPGVPLLRKPYVIDDLSRSFSALMSGAAAAPDAVVAAGARSTA